LSYLGGASPIRNSINRQSIKTLASLIGVVVVFFAYSGVAHADRFDAQIAALRTQAQQQQAVANQFTAQATDYQTRVNQLNAQMGALQAQISLSQAQSSRLTQQIADNESKLAQEKSVLGSNLKVMYLDSSISPLEMLASSNNLSDYFNQQQYQDSIKDKIQASMSTILQTQKDLARQQTDVTNLLVSQRTQNAQLAASRDEVNNLLAIASSNVAAANATVKNSNAQISSLKSQQAAILAAASVGFSGSFPGASSGSGGACDNGQGNGGYPAAWCAAPQDEAGYGGDWGYNRECVSWAGWRRYQLYAQGAVSRPVQAWGNANQWGDGARNAGFTVDNNPSFGAVAQTSIGAYGHVAVVEKVIAPYVIVSEMNYDGNGHFRYGKYLSSYFHYIH
jgi:surface antigen